MVVASWFGDEVAQDLAGGGVDDGDVEVLDEQDDVGSGVGSANAEVAEAARDAQGDAAGFVDLVAADAVVGVGAASRCSERPWAGTRRWSRGSRDEAGTGVAGAGCSEASRV
jgi:hypothetical protein